MNLTGIAWLALIVALLSLVAVNLWSRWRYRPYKDVAWFQLNPVSRDITPEAAQLAFKAVGRRNVRMWIVRIGAEPGTQPLLYIGLRGAQRPAATAEEIAKSAGCSVVPDAPPSTRFPKKGWRISYPKFPEQTEIDNPETSDTHSTDPLLYADHAAATLAREDVAILTVRPHRSLLWGVDAVMTTTSEQLANSWTMQTADTVTRSRPECVTCGLYGLAAVAVAGAAAAAWNAGSIAATIVSVPVALLVGRSLWKSQQLSQHARMLRRSATFRPSNKSSPLGAFAMSDIARWTAGGSSSTQTAPMTPAPDTVCIRGSEPPPGSILLGTDSHGIQVALPSEERKYGMFVQGSPGSGKTTLLLQAASEDIKARMTASPRAVMWIETKGEGVDRFAHIAKMHNAAFVHINALDPAGSARRLELIDWTNPKRSAHSLTSAFVYAFGDAIQDHSRAVLAAAFECACAMDAEASTELGWPNGRPNVIRVAYWLLGGDASLGKPDLARRVIRERYPDEWADLFTYMPRQGVSVGESEKNVKAPRNKCWAMLAARGIFEPDGRQPVTLDDMLKFHEIVLFDLSVRNTAVIAPSNTTGGNVTDYGEAESKGLASILMYALNEAIKSRCTDWGVKGHSVAIYSDELGTISGFGDGAASVIQELADQGRSRGVWAMFATQDPDQVPFQARRGINQFGNQVIYRMRDTSQAEDAAHKINQEHRGFTAEAIQHLGVGEGVAVLTQQMKPQPAFVLRAPLLEPETQPEP